MDWKDQSESWTWPFETQARNSPFSEPGDPGRDLSTPQSIRQSIRAANGTPLDLVSTSRVDQVALRMTYPVESKSFSSESSICLAEPERGDTIPAFGIMVNGTRPPRSWITAEIHQLPKLAYCRLPPNHLKPGEILERGTYVASFHGPNCRWVSSVSTRPWPFH